MPLCLKCRILHKLSLKVNETSLGIDQVFCELYYIILNQLYKSIYTKMTTSIYKKIKIKNKNKKNI